MKVEVRVISQDRRLKLISVTEILIILDITKTKSRIVLLYIEQKKRTNASHVFAPSLRASNTKRANLT